MVETETRNIPLGWKAVNFTLFNPYLGKEQSFDDLYSNRCTVVVFMCNHCPYVKHIMHVLKSFGEDMLKKDVKVSDSKKQIEQIYADEIVENVKKGWEKV